MTAAALPDLFPPTAVADPLRWGDQAACGPVDPTVMDTGGQEAADLCAGCRVRRECFTYALVTDQEGYWGGTDRDRRQVEKARGWQPGDPLPDPRPAIDSDDGWLQPPPRPIRDLDAEQRNGGLAATVDAAWIRHAWEYAAYRGITATVDATGVSTQTFYRLFDREGLGRPTAPRRNANRRVKRDLTWAEEAWQDATVRGVTAVATDRGVDWRTLQRIWDDYGLGQPVRQQITVDTVTPQWAQATFAAAQRSTIAKTARALGIGEKRLCAIWDHHNLGRPRRTA